MSLDINKSPYLQSLPRSNTLLDGGGFGRHGVRKSRDKESWLKKIWSQVFTTKKSKTTTAEHTRDRAKQRIEKQKERDRKNEEEKERLKEKEREEAKKREWQKDDRATSATKSRDAGSANGNTCVNSTATSNGNSPTTSTSVTSPLPKRPQSHPPDLKEPVTVKLPPIHTSTDSKPHKVSFGPSPGTTARPRAHSGKLRSSDRDSDHGSGSRNGLRKDAKSLSNIPAELANSPYLSSLKDKNLKDLMLERKKEFIFSKEQYHRPKPNFDGTPYRNSLPHRHSTEFSATSNVVDSWRRPKLPRGSSFTELEDRAKKIASKASKNNKIFTCDMPYPMDVYIRFSLRKREWVEKFNPKIQNSATRGGTSCKLEVEDDEDFEAICDQDVPAPWEEDYGIYAMMSRLVRHFPARFIWGGKGVNTLVLRNEVMVNHFTKAHYFSSKTGLTANIRDLSWYVPGDPYEYFPRSYILGEEEREDFTYDFQLTVCMSILKWVVEQNKEEENTEESQNEDNQKDVDSKEVVDAVDQEETMHSHVESQQSENTINISYGDQTEHSEQNTDKTKERNSADDTDQDDFQVGNNNDTDDVNNVNDNDDVSDTGDVNDTEDANDTGVNEEETDGENKNDDSEKDVDTNNNSNNTATITTNTSSNSPRRKVMPEISEPRKKKGGTVPAKCVDWALSQCERFINFKEHGDLDQANTKRLNLQAPQWESMYAWLEKIVKDGAKISNSDEKLEEVQITLERMRAIWPQFDIDGMRNLWIVKPGGKSKGIGIEFHSNLQEMLKYSDNGVLTGTYVVQKYIEQPLLIYNCKFDIRQWFLVTDWNPLTVWFYKDCYLRICSQEYKIDAMHEAVHLSNVSVQQFYHNGKRNEKLPDNNFMTRKDFEEYLSENGAPNAWEDSISPGMKEAIIHALMCTMDFTENRKNAFELYGADFMISEDFRPWLLEINSSPGMAPQSKEKAKLCAAVVEDTIKVVLDLRENKHSDTGDFELIFKDQPLPNFKCVDNKLYLRGNKIRKSDLAKYSEIDSKIKKEEKEKERREKEKQKKKEEEERRKEEKRQEEERQKEEEQMRKEEEERKIEESEEEEDSEDEYQS